jgi:uncharacterized protein (TIGR00730 family)
MKSVCVYCGSSPGSLAEYAQCAADCGRTLAARGVTVVYGGGNIGLMGIMADAALASGGRVIGVIPHALVKKELAHRGVTELIEVSTMHERKQKMADLADGFIALPGGIGTLEELCEISTWLQLGIHTKPVGLLNTAGFYDSFLAFLKRMREDRFLRPQHQAQLLMETSMERLLDRMLAFRCDPSDTWIDRLRAGDLG